MAEDQIGPMSPTPASAEEHGQLGGFSQSDDGASRRMRPGTKAADMADGPPLEELTDVGMPASPCLRALSSDTASWTRLVYYEDWASNPVVHALKADPLCR